MLPSCSTGGRKIWSWLLLLGLAHFSTEFVCSFWLTRTVENALLGGGGVFCYNALAFWTQPLVGWAVDRWRQVKVCLLVGGLLVLMAGIFASNVPWLTVVFLGMGNSLVHVGAGTLCIGLSRGSARGLGVMVGPGAAGLVLGGGGSDQALPYTALVMAVLLTANLVALWRIKECGGSTEPHPATTGNRWLAPVAMLVLMCIALRSALGLGFSFGWKGDSQAMLAIGLAMALGKIVGGFLADAFGWIAAVMAVLLLSVPFLWFGMATEWTGLIGLMLFQAPMAVTLGMLVRLFPNRPAFAFGLASAAVYGGAFLVMGNNPRLLSSFGGLTALSLGAAGMLWLSARLIPAIVARR